MAEREGLVHNEKMPKSVEFMGFLCAVIGDILGKLDQENMQFAVLVFPPEGGADQCNFATSLIGGDPRLMRLAEMLRRSANTMEVHAVSGSGTRQ